ncbi:MAG: hypothetical protein GXY33_10145 [Phycisphaerae bacterium]|nr:hypothetical protein [Phycisphaerae bacterium]
MYGVHPLRLTACVAVCLAASILISGCGSGKSKRRYDTRDGVVEAVDPATRRVTMTTFVPKLGRTIKITGQLAEDAEIYIDGKLADLSQIELNDRVRVYGYKEGDEIMATKVEILRTEGGSEAATVQKPAAETQPGTP